MTLCDVVKSRAQSFQRRRAEAIVLGIFAYLVTGEARGQAITSIHPDSTLPTTSIVTNSGGSISITGGTAVGANLFQSFSDFSLGQGQTVTWSYNGPASIQRVINRVTGGSASNVDGTLALDETLKGADFYFINPAGLIMGAKAHLDVSGSVYLSTASEISFSDGAKYSAVATVGSKLTMAPPVSFGFLGNEQPFVVTGDNIPSSQFYAPDAPYDEIYAEQATFYVAAPTVNISGSRIAAGSLSLIAPGAVATSVSIADMSTSSPQLLGDLSLSNDFFSTAVMASSQSLNGAINFKAGSVELFDSEFDTSNASAQASGSIAVTASGPITLMNTSVVSSLSGSGVGADIDLESPSITLTGNTSGGDTGSIIVEAMNNSPDASTHGGQVNISSNTLNILNDPSGFIGTSSQFNGFGGDVNINSDNINMRCCMEVSSTIIGDGYAGNINIVSSNISIDNTINNYDEYFYNVTSRAIYSASGAAGSLSPGIYAIANTFIDNSADLSQLYPSGEFGHAGNINIKANSIYLNGGVISSENDQLFGAAGSIYVTASTLKSSNLNTFGGGISTSSIGYAPGGAINVSAKSIKLDLSYISSTSGLDMGQLFNGWVPGQSVQIDDGSGNIVATALFKVDETGDKNRSGSGFIKITSDDLDVTDGAFIDTSSYDRGAAGSINIVSPVLVIDGAFENQVSEVASSNHFDGDGGGLAGTISISSSDVTLKAGGRVETDSDLGNAGNISVSFSNGGLLWLESGRGETKAFTSAISTSTDPDNGLSGGTITIKGPYSIIMNGGAIFAIGKDPDALVNLQVPSIIESSDRYNDIVVDGVFNLDGQIFDAGKSWKKNTEDFADASKVLRGQCLGRESSGRASVFATLAAGPYAAPNQPYAFNHGGSNCLYLGG